VSNSIPGESLTSVGFLGFDTKLYFFDVTSYPVIYAVSECIEDIFLPVPAHNLMVNLQDNYSNILYTLDIIQNFAGEISSSYTILPRCLETAIRILDIKNLREGAGKVMLFISDPKRSSFSTSRLETLRDYGIKLYQARIRCDMYVSANSYCDLQSLSLVCRYCGGEIYYYPYLRRSKATEKLAQEIKMNIMRETGWNCYIHVRVSSGWKIIQNYNGFRSLLNDRFSIPILNPDFTITYEIRNLRQTRLAVQAFLTYTSSFGIRKFRVMNYETDISPLPLPNPEILLFFYTKRAFNQSPSLSPSSYLLSLSQEISNSLSSLPNSSSFHSLLIYIASLLKHLNYFSSRSTDRGIHSSDDVSPDLTSCYSYKLEFGSVYASKLMSYPRLIGLHTGEWSRYLPISRRSISNDGVYLIDNGIEMFIWIGKNYLWKRFFAGDTRTTV
jgi:protein transport protein SEC24